MKTNVDDDVIIRELMKDKKMALKEYIDIQELAIRLGKLESENVNFYRNKLKDVELEIDARIRQLKIKEFVK